MDQKQGSVRDTLVAAVREVASSLEKMDDQHVLVVLAKALRAQATLGPPVKVLNFNLPIPLSDEIRDALMSVEIPRGN